MTISVPRNFETRVGTVLREILRGQSITRSLQNAMLEGVSVTGKVVDLGARNAKASYYRYIDSSEATLTYCDMTVSDPSIVEVDLERALPFGDRSFDAVLLMHVLEHIYNTRGVLGEMRRICRGQVLIAVPFLIPYHADPNDYFRFTHTALERLLREAEFSNVVIRPWGHGPLTATLYLAERVLRIRVLVAASYLLARYVDGLLLRLFPKQLEHKGTLGYLCLAAAPCDTSRESHD